MIQYLIFAECVVLVVLLFRGRRPVTQRWFAVWCSEVLLSVGLVSFLSGIGSDFFPDHSSPLIAAVLPAMMSLGALSGATPGVPGRVCGVLLGAIS